jgi:FkbM family methyltransferase
MLLKKIKKVIPQKYRQVILGLIGGHSIKSYSQEGEDLLIRKVFKLENYKGFYIDVGAHHPKRFSNTFLFYKRGWKGINIDAMPGSMKPFDRIRPQDINLEIPISAKRQELTYYAFEEPALNTFSNELGELRLKNKDSKLLFKKEIQTYTLEEILDKYLPTNQAIDFLTIDVEGLDFDVLKSNNWSKYKPTAVIIEAIGTNIIDVLNSDIYHYLNNIGYVIVSKTANTVIYQLETKL